MKPLRIFTLVPILIVGGFLAWNWLSWYRMGQGYEVEPRTKSSYLQTRLSEDLGYSGFESGWLQKAWVNGFREHTYLFLVVPDSTDLRKSIEKVAVSKDSVSISGGYLGPSTAPKWWNTETIDAAGTRYFRKESRVWRFTWIDGRLYIALSVT